MTIRVNTGVEGHTFDQSGATFAVGPEGELTISVSGGTVAVYADTAWSHVVDEQFTAPKIAAGPPPTAGSVISAPANAAPPAPTPVTDVVDVVPANAAPPVPKTPTVDLPAPPSSNAAPPVPVAAPAPDFPSSNPAPPPPA